jgi:hypothetical protein
LALWTVLTSTSLIFACLQVGTVEYFLLVRSYLFFKPQTTQALTTSLLTQGSRLTIPLHLTHKSHRCEVIDHRLFTTSSMESLFSQIHAGLPLLNYFLSSCFSPTSN